MHPPVSSTPPQVAQQQVMIELASLSCTLCAGYDTPLPLPSSTDLRDAQQRFFAEAVLKKGGHLGTFTTKKWRKQHGKKRYPTAVATKTWYNGVAQTAASPLKHEQRAFPSHPDRTFYFELADGGNTQLQISIGDEAPEDLPTFIGVHGMGGDSEAPYLHDLLSPLIKDDRGRGVVFNLRGCGDSTATSPAFHHGGCTSDLGAVVTWATMKWPKSKLHIVGTSLGAVIAEKFLAEWGEDCPVSAAALISPVYDFLASCKAMETNFVSRTIFNPAVGAFYSKLVKKNKDAFDLEHWRHTPPPTPFPPTITSPTPSLPSPPSFDPELPRESQPFGQDSRNSSFLTTSTHLTSIFSSIASPSTPGSSFPPTPFPGSTSLCLPSPQPSAPVSTEHTPEIKDALAKSLKDVTSRLFPQPLTKFCKSFVASTAHFLSGEDFMAETSAVKDLPNIRVPCLAVNCADDPLMPGADLPRSEAQESPYFVMAVPKKGGHLGTFTTKKWKKKNRSKRYHTAVVEEWFKANEALPQLRPRPQIINAHQGFVAPESHPEMAFHARTGSTCQREYGSSHTRRLRRRGSLQHPLDGTSKLRVTRKIITYLDTMYLRLKYTRPAYPKS